MASFALLIAVVMIAAGVLLISFLLLLRNKPEKVTGPQADESVPKYGECYDLCKRASGDAAEDCVGLCAYGWP